MCTPELKVDRLITSPTGRYRSAAFRLDVDLEFLRLFSRATLATPLDTADSESAMRCMLPWVVSKYVGACASSHDRDSPSDATETKQYFLALPRHLEWRLDSLPKLFTNPAARVSRCDSVLSAGAEPESSSSANLPTACHRTRPAPSAAVLRLRELRTSNSNRALSRRGRYPLVLVGH
jgi:hypothetical protein